MIRNFKPGRQDGIVLLEALAAVLVFSFGILAFLWMQAAATREVTDSKYRLEASFAANQVLGEMWVHRDDLAPYIGEDVAVEGLPGGTRTVAINGNQVTITIKWKSPGESKAHSYQAVAQING